MSKKKRKKPERDEGKALLSKHVQKLIQKETGCDEKTYRAFTAQLGRLAATLRSDAVAYYRQPAGKGKETVKQQESKVRAYAKKNGLDIVAEFSDCINSGANGEKNV